MKPSSNQDTELLEPRDPHTYYPQRIAHSKEGMVVAAHYRAAQAGSSILARGGNAFDAAVATAFALGVCEPAASGLGGQTMAVIFDAENRKKIALDGSSRVPHRVEPGALPREQRLLGYKAATVPSTPATLAYILERYGTLQLAEVLAPAISLANDGYRVTTLQRFLTKREIKSLRAGTAAPFFLKKGLNAYRIGELHRQPVLAKTLERLASAGIVDFYQGEIAKHIHDDMVRHDGYIRDDDLAQIPYPIERRPLTTKFGDWRVFTMPPPGSGHALIEVLNVLDALPEKLLDIDSPRGALAFAEIIKQANLDRNDQPRDPNLHPQDIDEELLISPDYGKTLAKRITKRVRTRGETTHLSVMDKAGNAVALTQSIERVYGSCAVTAELGFLYNNYISAFEYTDITHPYFLRPGASPWASVAPTVIFRGRSPFLTIGSPGSERIVSAVAQVLLRLRRGESPFEAVDAPRMHSSTKGRVSLEASRMHDALPELLEKHEMSVDVRDPYSFYLGCVALIMRGRRGELTGVADPRRDGSAAKP